MNTIEARDAMLTVFKTAWDILGYPATYEDVTAFVPTSETVWARATIRHAHGGQASLAGIAGTRIWESGGILNIQIFAPVGDGSKSGYVAAQSVLNAFRVANVPGVWFKNQRIKELGSDGSFMCFSVLTDFSYEDVR